MTRRIVMLDRPSDRRLAHELVDRAADAGGCVVEFRTAKRTDAQNRKMWACLNDIAKQTDWHGSRLQPEDWKLLFMQALTSELRLVPNMAGDGFVPLGRSSSRLSKGEMSDLIELVFKFGAERGVQWSDPQEKAA